ncbi:MAG: hypothetical protein P1P88_22805 [Bacteroidales bacterium]|nr:hypothetical protein [Bacteroidales bacterium]
MIKYLLAIYLFFQGANIYSQNFDAAKVKQIDLLVSQLSDSAKRNNYFEKIDASGLIHEKSFIVFKKLIGSFSTEVFYQDTSIYAIENITNYIKDDEIVIENYYFDHNSLIKYELKTTKTKNTDNNEVLQHHILAYFSNDNLVGLTQVINDDYVFDVKEQKRVKARAKSDNEGYASLINLRIY